MAITIDFENRAQSIAFFEAWGGMPNTVAALKEAEAEERYQAALDLVNAIEPEGASRLAVHWHDAGGRLLRTLDEVVRAILADEVVLPGDTTSVRRG